jgi:hypothetical protein
MAVYPKCIYFSLVATRKKCPTEVIRIMFLWRVNDFYLLMFCLSYLSILLRLIKGVNWYIEKTKRQIAYRFITDLMLAFLFSFLHDVNLMT